MNDEPRHCICCRGLGLSTRATNALLNAGITTVEQLQAKPIEQLLRDLRLVRNLGKKSLREIAQVRARLDARLDRWPRVY